MEEEKRRVYVYEELYQEVTEFAYNRWKTEKERAPNGCPLFRSFPASLKRYMEVSADSSPK